MKKSACPYLGMKDNPGVSLTGPSPDHHCQNSLATDPIDQAHQSQYCLLAAHSACPLYSKAAFTPPVPVEAVPEMPRQSSRASLSLFSFVYMLVGIALLAIIFGLSTERTGGLTAGIDYSQRNLTAWAVVRSEDSPAVVGNVQSTAVPEPAEQKCASPKDWVAYTVSPTDSLYRLAVIHRVPIEAFQSANCLGDDTLIRPGQVIYVPKDLNAPDTNDVFVAYLPITGKVPPLAQLTAVPVVQIQPPTPTAVPPKIPAVVVQPQPTSVPKPPEDPPAKPPAPIVQPTDPPADPPPTLAPTEAPKKDREDRNRRGRNRDRDRDDDDDDDDDD